MYEKECLHQLGGDGGMGRVEGHFPRLFFTCIKIKLNVDKAVLRHAYSFSLHGVSQKKKKKKKKSMV